MIMRTGRGMGMWRLLLVAGMLLAGYETHALSPTPTKEPPVINVMSSEEKITLNPRVQHIPLDPKLAHLRPPPPYMPENPTVFVGLSAFRDGFRCGKTLFTGFKRASHPDRIHFGVVDQVNADDAKCLDEYCKLANAEWPDHECRYREQVRIDSHLADDSRGPTLARHYQQKLVRDEDFCLQLDSHSLFSNKWEENLMAEWKGIGNEMAVLTTYLHDSHDFIKENGDNNPPVGWLPHLCTTMRGGNGCVRTVGASMITGSFMPQLEALWGAGLSFSKCHSERRVLIDSHTLWMFDGEEFLRASHLWTHGYDLYSPSGLGSVVYHNYSKVPARFEFVKVDQAKKKIESERAVNRFFLIVGKPFKGEVDTFELDKYGFGTARSFQHYLNFSGVTFKEGVNDTHSCNQLHWVPYTNASEVEEVVGRGWKLYPEKMKKVVAPGGFQEPKAPVATGKEFEEELDVDDNGDDKNNKKKTVNPEPPSIGQQKLRQDANTMPTASTTGLVVFVVAAVLLFVFILFRGSCARSSHRQFRPVKQTSSP